MTTYNCSNASELQTAATSATIGDLVNITANISSGGPSTGTNITFATGMELNGGGFTVDGYNWLFDGGVSGEYTETYIHDILIDHTATTDNTPFIIKNGNYRLVDVDIDGISILSGSTKSLSITCSNIARCEATLTTCSITNGGGDLVYANAGGATANASSFCELHNCTLSTQGTASSDNNLTSHDDFPVYMYGGSMTQGSGSGPICNHAPEDVTCELYGVTINLANSTYCIGTKIVGCTTTGTGTLRLIGDSLKPAEPSIAAWNTGTANYSIRTQIVAPILYGNTITVQDKSIEGPVPASVLSAVIARCTLAGPFTANAYGISLPYSVNAYNCSIDAPAGGATNSYPLATVTNGAGATVMNARRMLINGSNRTSPVLTYGGRGDRSNTTLNIYDSRSRVGTAIIFTPGTVSNCTTDNTEPTGGNTGAAFICDELKAIDAYGLEGYDYATTPIDDIILYYGLYPPTSASAVADSDTQCTVSYTNNNGSARDHRITRATDSGFTANVVTFDDASVASGAATYVDTTCSAGTTYYYRIQALNSGALSLPADTASVTTLTWQNMSGETSRFLPLTGLSPTDVGRQFRCVVTNSEGEVTSDEAEILP